MLFHFTEGPGKGRNVPKKKRLKKLLKVAQKQQQELAALEGTPVGKASL